MSRPPYPHRCLGGDPFVWACRCGATPEVYSAETARDGWGSDCPIALRERIAEQDRHISSLDCRFAGHFAELSGKHCPPGQPCERCEAESRAERAEAERDAARDEARRLRDLVRHQRGPLHDAELLTDEEYAALAVDAGAVTRLRGYDELRREIRADTDKAVSSALEARAKEIERAADQRDVDGDLADKDIAEAMRLAARIVRGAP